MKIKKDKGFTLVEMMVVVAILVIMSMVAVPYLSRFVQNSYLRTAARDLADDIAFCKQSAVAQNVHYRISFNVAGNNYAIEQGGQLSTDPFVTLRTKSPSDQHGGITLSAPSFTGGNTFILFQPRGTCFGGSVVLTNSRLSTQQIITSLMGRVRIQANEI